MPRGRLGNDAASCWDRDIDACGPGEEKSAASATEEEAGRATSLSEQDV